MSGTERIYRWGVAGTGAIASTFVNELRSHPRVQFTAVSSSSRERAETFAREHDIATACEGVDELGARDDVDIVYVASVHTEHVDQAIRLMRAGKAVLCEKPMGVTPRQVERAIAVHEETGTFMMEAMKTPFLPGIRQAQEWVKEGRIGDVRRIHADFCFHTLFNPESRLFDPKVGGGAILDVGIYSLEAVRLFLGYEDLELRSAVANKCPTGVEDHAIMMFTRSDGAVAIASCATLLGLPRDLNIFGTRGRIHVPLFHKARSARLRFSRESEELYEAEDRSVYTHEAVECMRCLDRGAKQSDIMPLSATLATSRWMHTALEMIHGNEQPEYMAVE